MRKSNKKYLDLVNKLNKCSQAYHGDSVSLISDEDYDKLYHELLAMEKRDPSIIVPESPTQRVGEAVDRSFKQVRHFPKMYSLDNVFNHNDLSRFWKRFDKLRNEHGVDKIDNFYCDYKMDGLSCEIIYEDGRLVSASTRGDGTIGEDVTANILTLPTSLPKYVCSTNYRFIVRGEVIVHRSDFNTINARNRANGSVVFSNPRNYAAGSLRQKNPEITRQRNLKFYAWDAILGDNVAPQPHSRIMRMLAWLGFSIPPGRLCKSIKDIEDFIAETNNVRKALPYDIDGIVIKQDNPIGDVLGWNQHAPLFNIAYKFAASNASTTITGIDWDVGRTGRLTPVANIDPISFDGVNVSKVTLNNAEYIETNKLGIGSVVSVCRSADVIPKITEILEPKGFTGLLDKCPSCGAPLTRASKDLVCTNSACTSKKINNLLYILKDVVKFKGIGDKAASLLVKSGAVTSLVDLFKPIKAPEGVSQDLIDNLVITMQGIPLTGLLSMLGIPGLGTTTARKLLYEVDNLPKLIKILDDRNSVMQLDIPDYVKQSILKWYADPGSRKLLEELFALNISNWM